MKNFKDSGIEWLGEIPEHWEVVKIKHIFNIGRGRVISQEELDENGNFPVYSSQTTNNGILGYIKTYDFDCEQITWTTDGVNAGTIFLRNGKYNCTNVCGILKLRNNENMSFLTYALQNVAPYYKRPDTNGAKIMNNEMANIQIVYPPLKEQKQALINETITKGLDKNVNFKDSGIEWLGEIPQHWRIVKFKYVAFTNIGLVYSPDDIVENSDEGYPVLRANNIQNGKIDYQDLIYIKSKQIGKKQIISSGDLLMCVRNGSENLLGKTAKIQDGYFSFGTFTTIIKSQFNDYFYWIFQTNMLRKSIASFSASNGIGQISQDDIKNFIISFPPLKEQEQIAKFLDEKCKKIDLLIEKTEKQIELIKEYKTTLINQAVCGRIDL
ncbi:restriction endonuclease subunit S [Campylobacter jejuni]|nr:restriction endonuclease subunit S [Campylobacter jejuni]